MDYYLDVLDYVIVVAALVFSSGAGFYYGVVKKKNESVEEYFLASRELGVFKMACSMFATGISSGYMVGIVAEIYSYGSQFTLMWLTFIPAVIISTEIFFPVFYNVGSFDLYKYYELKFNRPVRLFLSSVAVIEKTLSSSTVTYATATVLNKVTGINVWIIITIITIVCVLYSALGGVRGVTLADTIQSVVIVVSVITLLIIGFITVGGFTIVWERNLNFERLEFFKFDGNVNTRHTFWTATVGGLISAVAAMTTSPTTTLRVMSGDSLRKCKKATYYGGGFMLVVSCFSFFVGLLTFAHYYNCDPVSSGTIKSSNQLISLFVSDTLSPYPGFVGVFYAGLLCAAISTLSSNYNGMSALFMESFVRPFNVAKDDVKYTRLAKIVVILLGLVSLIGTLIVQRFPNVYQALVVLSFSNGPHFILLVIGTFFPQANIKSSLGSFGVGLLFMIWLLVGSVLIKPVSKTKPVTTSGCIFATNFTTTTTTTGTSLVDHLFANGSLSSYNATTFTSTPIILLNNSTEIIVKKEVSDWSSYFPLSSVSFNWYTAMGAVVTIVTFILLSFCFGSDANQEVDSSLIPDPVQKFHKKLNKRWRKIFMCDIYAESENRELTVIQSETLLRKDKIPE